MLATKNYKTFQIVSSSGTVLHEFEGATLARKTLPGDSVSWKEGGAELVARGEKQLLVGVLCLTSKYMYGMTGHGVPMYLCEPMNKGFPSFRVACKEKDRSSNLLISFQFDSWDEDAEHNPQSVYGSTKIYLYEKLNAMGTTGTFNIDPPGCKDIDDVITLESADDKIWKISVTIADVSEMIKIGSPQWNAARAASATVYQDGTVVRPMLHRHLSEEVCSLIPGKVRYGVALMSYWEGGHLSTPFFKKVLVTNQESYTYESIYKSKNVPLDILKEICSELAGRSLTDSHEWVEHLMLWYNRNAAKILRTLGTGLLRRHDAPFEEKLAHVKSVSPDLEFLAYRSAEYCGADVEDVKHHGLTSEVYCHASSPIRRFADLINQVLIKRWIDGDRVAVKEDYASLALELNRRQKMIAAHDRHYALLKAIHGAVRLDITGRVLWSEKGKVALWIDEWKTLIRIRTENRVPGEMISLRYFCDRRKAQWKEKILYEIRESGNKCEGAHI